jgi:nicotinamide phosphoribosyltransferase
MKKIIRANLEETGDPGLIDHKLHDFGFRGVSSVETAGLGAAAHLVNFRGTDTLAGLVVARDYYFCPMAGQSIPASEHSTITAWGAAHERDAFANMLDQYPEGLVACVSDSYDIYRACSQYWGSDLKDRVLNRNGTLVIRPDSGDPCAVLPRVFQLLGAAFGYQTNAKGFKVLPASVRVIQGDGIDIDSLPEILDTLKRAGWSGDNITFGSGGGLLQKLNRDTLKFAFKCSAVTVDGTERAVFKQPITDPGKRSKTGKLKLIHDASGWRTVSPQEAGDDALVEVFRDGTVTRTWPLEEIRARAALPDSSVESPL